MSVESIDNAVEALTNPLRRNELAIICKSICESAINGEYTELHVRNQDAYDLCDVLDFIAHTHAINEELRENVESFIQTVNVELSKADMWELVEAWYRLTFEFEDMEEYVVACESYRSFKNYKSHDTVIDNNNHIHISFVKPPPVTVIAIVENSIEVMQEKKMESSDFTIEQLQAMLAAKQAEAKTKRESALFTALEAFYRDGGKWEDVARISKLVTHTQDKSVEKKPKANPIKLNAIVNAIRKFGNKYDFSKAGVGSFEEYKNSWKEIKWRNDGEKTKQLDTIVAKLQSDCTYDEFIAEVLTQTAAKADEE